MEITTLHSLDTEYSADSIEWCPHPEFLSYFVCGTYQLEGNNSESTSPPCRRKGRIYLFRFDIKTNELNELFRIETAAILDMKWLQNRSLEYPTLAAANALGQIEVFSLEDNQLKLKSSLDLNPEFHNLLALSLDCEWYRDMTNIGSSSALHRIVASDSKGDINLLEYDESGLKKLNSWSAHNFEAWICAFDKWNPHQIYTGGDDTFMHIFDFRSATKVLTNKSHIAGVTCLLSHPKKEHILLTGSYDERMRVFDTRSMRDPLTEINLNGGIWRLKSDPIDSELILCACMYHNFSIVRLREENCNHVDLVGLYNEHDSICYGADWCRAININDGTNSLSKRLYMATCSFYDHKLCISSVNE